MKYLMTQYMQFTFIPLFDRQRWFDASLIITAGIKLAWMALLQSGTVRDEI